MPSKLYDVAFTSSQHDGTAQMRRHKPEIAIVLLLLLTPVLVWVYWYVRLSREIRAEWDRVRAEGYPTSVDDLTPAPVPDEQNAAIGYMQAMRILTSGDAEARRTGVNSPKREALDAVAVDRTGPTPVGHKRLREALAAPIVKHALAETVRASRLPACAFAQPAPAFPQAGASVREWDQHFVLLPLIADLIGHTGMLHDADGEPEAALECDLTILRMARHALQCPSFPAQEAGAQMLVQSVYSLRERLHRGRLTQAQIREVSRELDGIDQETWLRNTIAHARVRFADEVFRTTGSRRDWLNGRAPCGDTTPLPWVPYAGRWVHLHEAPQTVRAHLYFTPVGLPWHKRDELEFLKLCRQLLDLTRQPPGMAARAADQLARAWWARDMTAMAPVTAGFARYGRDAVSCHAWAATTIAECRVALALQAFHGPHGRYPASIDELLAASSLPVPTDPYSGKPFRYRLADGGACEYYSVGENGRDDGGQHTVLIINLGDLIEDDCLRRCVPGPN